MRSVFDLPYDVLREIFTRLAAVDVFNFLRISRKLYYPLIDDDSTWYIFCARYGITDTSTFRRRSFRTIYGRLLHRYGALLGMWCSDYPFAGNVVEFRIVPDEWLRRGEPIIIGEVWEFSKIAAAQRPCYPVYTEFVQIGFTPWKKATPQTANDVQISWHVRSERNLGFLVHNGLPPPWVRMDGDGRLATPSLHVIAPTNVKLGGSFMDHLTIPEMVASAPWCDADRGVPRLPQEGPPPISQPPRVWYFHNPKVRYVEGAPKPAAIAFFPPPHDQNSDVRIPDLHNPPNYFSRDFANVIPCYYPLRQTAHQGDDPTAENWRPEMLEGLWLGDYDVHGTECLFLEYSAGDSMVRAWKITGDPHVPRGVCSWEFDLQHPASDSGPSGRSYQGRGTLANLGFSMSEKRPVRVTIAGRDEIVVSWDFSYKTKFIRYRQKRGRVGAT
ncbi:hypothetical protein BD414DRAFT_491422 [Trametes punicea]|nr:hypothetical protein BD414DRAFT_491422 [Trametes punicea]